MRYAVCLLFSMLGFCINGFGQDQPPDTLSKAERAILESQIRKTAFGHFRLTDSFSRRGDSVRASEHLASVDPLMLVYFEYTEESLPRYLNKLRVTAEARAAYRARFAAVLSAPRSAAYTAFEKMNAEDQALRVSEGRAADSLSYALISRKMRLQDSLHFEYLYHYVQKNGWPTIADGALYASVLAIHDHDRHEYYIQVLKKAVGEGKAPIELLEMLLQWRRHRLDQRAYKAYLDTAAKLVFNVSSMLRHIQPSSLARIQNAFKQHCPKYYLIHEAPSADVFWGYMNRVHSDSNGEGGSVLTRFANEIYPYCPRRLYKDLWAVKWMPAERERLMLYLIW
jgi:hypothetical protein